eukprot:CAMPEP_0197525102 /NCGR_PEP_ID=MMETSP1318-20131121/10621_1 /TAXON_ID=552666 /ORGANISM="Partenskyella glossopodia, Strain RCC365" /LENGTH=362 /DNA_ID=CAMNT_0043078271 /DNA_START=6 /DNA_END=1094 /DNA_ORIENTATION=-
MAPSSFSRAAALSAAVSLAFLAFFSQYSGSQTSKPLGLPVAVRPTARFAVSTRTCGSRVAALGERVVRRKDIFSAGTIGLFSIAGAGRFAKAEAPFTGTTPVDKLVPGVKDKQRTELYQLMKQVIGTTIDSPATSINQLVLLDALSRDKETKTGGIDGSIQYELDTYKLTNLKKTVDEIKQAQAKINDQWKSEDKLSFADVMIFAGYLKTAQQFKAALMQRSTNGGGATIASGFGNPFPIPPLGRKDTDQADGNMLQGTSVPEIVARLYKMGFIARDIAALGIYFPGAEDLDSIESQLMEVDDKIKGAVKSGIQSRKTVTQNAYQVNVGEAYLKLVTFGQSKVDPLAYYYPAAKLDLKKVKL